ncbi:gtp binding protein, partial [Alternaria burnsii]
MAGNKKKNKNKANANANENINSGNREKMSRSSMIEKREDNKDGTVDPLDSSPVWSGKENGDKAPCEADVVVDSSEEPAESSRTTEQMNDVVAAEQGKDGFLHGELSQLGRVVNESERLPTITQSRLDSSNVSCNTRAEERVSKNGWASGREGVQDVTVSQEELSNGFQPTPEVQVSQESVEMTANEVLKKDEVVPTTENIAQNPGLEDTVVSEDDDGNVSSSQPQSHLQPPSVPAKQLLDDHKTPSREQSCRPQASAKLPTQIPKLDDRPALSEQEIRKQPTIQAVPTESHLPSKPKVISRDEKAQMLSPKLEEGIEALRKRFVRQIEDQKQRFKQREQKLIAEREFLNDNLEATHAEITRLESLQALPQTLKPTTRDQGTQTATSTDSLTQEPKLQGRPSLLLHGILEKPSNTTPSSVEPRTQEQKSSDATRKSRFHDTLKSENRDPSKNMAQPAQEQKEAEFERKIHSLARQVAAEAPEQVTHSPRTNIPALSNRVQPSTVPPTTIQPSHILRPRVLPTTAGRYLKLIVNNNAQTFLSYHEHILATNTAYFTLNAKEDTSTSLGRNLGWYVNFSGVQFSLEVIKEYTYWLKDGIIRTVYSLVRGTHPNVNIAFRFLVFAYVFGEHIDDKRWMNDVMDAFVGAHSRVWRIETSLIVHTYKFTKHTSPMRRLLAD